MRLGPSCAPHSEQRDAAWWTGREWLLEYVDIVIQGTRLRVRSNFAPLPDYLCKHLPYHIAARGNVPDRPAASGATHHAWASDRVAPDIDVNVRWFDAADASDDALVFDGQDELQQIGARHLADEDVLVWTDTVRVKGLSFRFRVTTGRLTIEAAYVYAPRAEKLAENPHYLERRLFGLTSWLVYHPLAWYLEHFRGLYLLHASGVSIRPSDDERHGRAIVIPGVGGVGKTTTCVALVAQGGRLISENLVFHDAENVYSCYEPIRLDQRSVGLLRDSRHTLEKADIPDGAKSKNMYHLGPDAVVDVAPGGWLFVPRFTRSAFMREIEVAECVERLLTFNELTREVNDYAWFAATLNLKWPTSRSLERRAETLRAFVQSMQCYEIGIDRGQGIEPVLHTILHHTQGATP